MKDDPQLGAMFAQVPASLHQILANYAIDWRDACARSQLDPVTTGSGLPVDMVQLGKTWACSDFVARACIRFPEMFYQLLDEGMHTARSLDDYVSMVNAAIDSSRDGEAVLDEAVLMQALRRLRRREMLRIAWRDLNQLADVSLVLQELSDCAQAFVAQSLRALDDQHARRYGKPLDSRGQEQELLVFAMGKMGGSELNFSSDIDLVFCFAEDGQTTGRSQTTHAEYYTAVVRKLVKVLDEVTADGFVYRVDTRLRPFGQSGPLVMSFSGLEQYYQLHGRDWERYAMIKARLITGRVQDRKYLQALLTPFVFRRYLDFSMIDSIREMKSMINTQVQRKGMLDNIKLGRGGIREIEFIGQTLQLIRAGRDPALRERGIIRVLQLMAEKQFLAPAQVDALVAAYAYLRRLENRLQMLADKQTHSLPGDEIEQQRILLAMAADSWQSLLDTLAGHQDAVDAVFQQLVAPESEQQQASDFALYWAGADKNFSNQQQADTALSMYLQSLGYTEPDAMASAIGSLQRSSAVRHLAGGSARLMAQLVEGLLDKIADYPDQVELFERVSRILRALAGRKVYLSMLSEFPVVQMQMLTLCATSEWFTERLTRYPILLDSLMNTAEAFRRNHDVRKQLQLELKRIESDTMDDASDDRFEQTMERMRQFKRQTVFTVAMLDVFYQEPVELVSDRLTELADVLLERILEYSWQAMVKKYGEPRCIVDGEACTPAMGIVAYGKMGGNELGYGSDLDIIFVHNSQGEKQLTTGTKSIDNQQFFARVAQRIIHFLNTRSYSGVLYEADTRLRPDGQAGLMVSSLAAFERYQQEKAWTWEHQALIRARFITETTGGGPGEAVTRAVRLRYQASNIDTNEPLAQEFARIRRSVLARQRDRATLLSDVVDMREKMRAHLGGKSRDTINGQGQGFDLKHDRGGLVDIEFVTQAGVLLNAATNEDCIRHTATLELIKELQAAGWYQPKEAEQLSDAYRCLRQLKNWQKLKCVGSGHNTGQNSGQNIGEQAGTRLEGNGLEGNGPEGNGPEGNGLEQHRRNVSAVWDRLMPAVDDD